MWFSSGRAMVQQCLRAGLLDELIISLVPVALGDGIRLLDGTGLEGCEPDIAGVIDAPGVT